MIDRVTPQVRSRMMSAVRGKNTCPEHYVRKTLHSAGFRFRIHRRDLPGRPDILLPKHRTAVFVHGCFWHGHGQRTGKTTIAEAWTDMLGPTNTILVRNDEVGSAFKGKLYNKQLAVFEEIFLAGFDAYNELKLYTASDVDRAQTKGVDFADVQPPKAILALSNHRLPIMIPEAGDARWYVIHTDAERQPDAYYERLREEGWQQLSAFKAALATRDISKFNPHAPPPMTEAKLTLISSSRSPIDEVLDDFLSGLCGPLFTWNDVRTAFLVRSVNFQSEPQVAKRLRFRGAIALGQKRLNGADRDSVWVTKGGARWEQASLGELQAEWKRQEKERKKREGG